LCNFCPIFPSFFLHFSFIFYSKKLTPHGIIKPTKTERFCAAFKVQAGISGSALFIILSARVCFLFSGALSLSFFFFFFFTLFVFQKSPFPAILFSLLLNLLPRAIKELLPKKKKKKKKKEKPRKSVPCNRFGFVVVLLKNNALLTFPLYLFNRTNRLGKRPSSLASCTTNSTPRTKRRSASTFYRKRYTWRILEAFDYNCGIQLARSDFDR
jgi:hypothetical protein